MTEHDPPVGHHVARGPDNEVPLFRVEDLCVQVEKDGVSGLAVDKVSLLVDHGKMVSLVGESASGKTLTALGSVNAIMSKTCRVIRGRSLIKGVDVLGLLDHEYLSLMRGRVGVVLQHSLASFHPLWRVGRQLVYLLRGAIPISRREGRRRVIEILWEIGLEEPENVYNLYPHEVSGGMAQRLALARALVNTPDLLIADEITSALDTINQKKILEKLKKMQESHDMGVLLVTHDLWIASSYADIVAVMYAGEIVEEGPSASVFNEPVHPYTIALLAALPAISEKPVRSHGTVVTKMPGIEERSSNRCMFEAACNRASRTCRAYHPELVKIGHGRSVRCFLEH